MHRFFIEENYKEKMIIKGPDARHIISVLRMNIGDELEFVTDDAVVCRGVIESLDGDEVHVHSIESIKQFHEAKIEVTLAQGLAKGDKMDFIVQKAVELGVVAIVPLAMEHSVVHLQEEREKKKIERWQKIAHSAAEQSKRDIVPKVYSVHTLREILQKKFDLILLAYECETTVSMKDVLQKSGAQNILLIIGPEGGLTLEEVELAKKAGAKTVSLGRRILRAETASLVGLSCIFYEKDSI